MKTQEAVQQLQKFVRILAAAGVTDRKGYHEWRKRDGSEALMEDLFGYRRTGTMPSITALLAPYFHATLPLIGLNYSPVAHNTLHAFPHGWTTALRLCRGIIFDREGNLVGKGFDKFFNFGEHPETTDLPDEPFDATEKKDGHLGIIFAFRGELMLATRQSFGGPSALLGNAMLAEIAAKKGWKEKFPPGTSVLVEIIHPKTHVHVDYGRKKGFVLIGAYDNATLRDRGAYGELMPLAKALGIPVTERWQGTSIKDLRKLMKDMSVRNKEGFVVRFASGLRVKFKFESYIGLMVEEKLSYTYLMNRMAAGNLERMLDTLDAEVRPKADEMVRNIRKVSRFKDEKKRREYLYALDPEKQKNQYYRGICRKYLKRLQAAKA
ncbi:MAG TPA: T4 RnlA family RNA ligase [Patescibacteria group bacterium]|nr:T4 RnlA family RNA ligase [Patescibacteria group bacterium]